MFKNLRKKKKGFTLIELIIVIAIIAILAAFAVPKFGAIRKDAALKSDIANAKTIANAAAALIAEGEVTTDTTGSVVSTATDTDKNGKKIADYLQNVPKTETKYGSVEKGAYFSITVDDKGNVKVTPTGDTTELFPELKVPATPES